MLLHLIRHGQTDWNQEKRIQGQSESRLTELGRQQATELATTLAEYPIEAVWCSSSRRARETAELAFAERRLPMTFLDSLREIHLGPWEGRLYAEIESAHPEAFWHFWNSPDLFMVKGAESFLDLQQRGLSAVADIVRGNDHAEIAVVSHGALIKALLCHYEGRHLCDLWEPPHMHNCAHSIIEIDKQGVGHILRYAGEDRTPRRQQQ